MKTRSGFFDPPEVGGSEHENMRIPVTGTSQPDRGWYQGHGFFGPVISNPNIPNSPQTPKRPELPKGCSHPMGQSTGLVSAPVSLRCTRCPPHSSSFAPVRHRWCWREKHRHQVQGTPWHAVVGPRRSASSGPGPQSQVQQRSSRGGVESTRMPENQAIPGRGVRNTCPVPSEAIEFPTINVFHPLPERTIRTCFQHVELRWHPDALWWEPPVAEVHSSKHLGLSI